MTLFLQTKSRKQCYQHTEQWLYTEYLTKHLGPVRRILWQIHNILTTRWSLHSPSYPAKDLLINSDIQNYLFQKTLQEVTRRSISSFPLEHPNWTVFLIAFCSSLTDFIPATISYQRTVKDQFKIHVFVVYGATVLYVKMILAIWLMHTHSVSLAAKLLKDSLVEVIFHF